MHAQTAVVALSGWSMLKAPDEAATSEHSEGGMTHIKSMMAAAADEVRDLCSPILPS